MKSITSTCVQDIQPLTRAEAATLARAESKMTGSSPCGMCCVPATRAPPGCFLGRETQILGGPATDRATRSPLWKERTLSLAAVGLESSQTSCIR